MKSIEISNFKNFRYLKVDNFKRLNLIIGKNNTGKSTLLEAISIMASGADIEWIKKLLAQRGLTYQTRIVNIDNNDIEHAEKTLCSLYHNHDRKNFYINPIILKANAFRKPTDTKLYSEIKLYLAEVGQIREIKESGEEISRRVIIRPDENAGMEVSSIHPALIAIRDNNAFRYIHSIGVGLLRPQMLDLSVPFQYVRTTDFTPDNNAAMFDKIALTPLEDYLIEALQIIDKRIKAINFLKDDDYTGKGERREPFVVLKDTMEKYKLSIMGDGINRILTIILSLLNSGNGILLIDEFENGLHYSIQKSLWSFISTLAIKLNVQVFVTTHSNDCITSFIEATSSLDESCIIRLEKRKTGEIAVLYCEAEELAYIGNNNVEIR